MKRKNKLNQTYSPSLTDLLIATLFSARSSKNFREIINERKIKNYEKNSISVALSRLTSRGYVNKNNNDWYLTIKGKNKYKNTCLLNYINSPFNKNPKINTIIAFDIPENNRVVRNWLRNQIKIFGYKILQQSLWIGPGPLPESFLQRLEDLNIRKNVKTFKISKSKN